MHLLRRQVSQLSVFVLGRWRVVHATAVFGSLASQIVQRTKKNVKTILLRDEWNAVFDSKMIHFVSFLSSPWMTIIT